MQNRSYWFESSERQVERALKPVKNIKEVKALDSIPYSMRRNLKHEAHEYFADTEKTLTTEDIRQWAAKRIQYE